MYLPILFLTNRKFTFMDASSPPQLTMAPALMGEKPVDLHETASSQDPLPSASMSQDSLLDPVQTPVQQRETFDPYGSFMNTIYTSFLQVSERDSYPELPPPLSPRRAFSVHNPDLTRLGLDTAQSQSPARGTPKPSEDPSTPPPCDAPLEEAKTDGSATACVYSNGVCSAAGGRGGEDEEEGRRPQGYLSPAERLREAAEDIRDAEHVQVRARITASSETVRALFTFVFTLLFVFF